MRPVLLAALLLSGCAAPVPAFVDGRGREVIPVAFIPGASVPVSSDAQCLLALRRSDGPALIFRPPGQLAAVRADAVARLSGRPVQIVPGSAALAAAGAADQGVLVLPDAADVALDPCLGPVGRGVGGLLPGSERNTQAMLPPGCATEQMLRAQAADPSDLLRGRPLAPGTALPFAEAAEKYLQRNSTNAAGGRSAGLTSGGPPPADAPAPVFGRGLGAPSGTAEPPASPPLAPAPSAAPGRAAPTELLGPL